MAALALAALLLVPAGAASVSKEAPLTILAGRLVPALAELPPAPVLPETGLVPRALRTARAEALVEAAERAGLPVRPVAPASLQAGRYGEKPAQRLLRDVNAVFQGVPAARLREMPLEELPGLAAAVLDQALPGGAVLPLETASLLTGMRAKDILSRRGREEAVYRPYAYANDGHELPVYDPRVPRDVRPHRAQVYRHYTSERGREAILASGALRNGILPFIRRDHGVSQTYFERLTGAFLTLPGLPGRQVGVREENAAFVDLRVPEGVPVLEVRPGDIFMIPLPARPETWVEELYWRWVGGDRGALSYLGTLPRFETRGGPGPSLAVPVEVLDAGSR